MANKLRLIIQYQSQSSLKKRKQLAQLDPNSAAKLCQLRINLLENNPKLNHLEKVSTIVLKISLTGQHKHIIDFDPRVSKRWFAAMGDNPRKEIPCCTGYGLTGRDQWSVLRVDVKIHLDGTVSL